jgi:stalled ribosome alternative rescue factor ArfA
MSKTFAHSKERIREIQELRRSAAAQPHKNKTAYSRKRKHSNKGWE